MGTETPDMMNNDEYPNVKVAAGTSAPEVERRVMWRCDGCGAELIDDDVEPYGEGFCHVVAVHDANGDPEPAPCGPVNRLDT